MVTNEALVDVAAAVADGEVVDWASTAEALTTDEERQVLGALQFIAQLTPSGSSAGNKATSPSEAAQSHRAEKTDPPLEHWGPLKIIDWVGRGTFGDVYRAWDGRLDREVALKILRHRDDEDNSSTVVREGRLLARVRHPNVVTVYGAERIDGRVGVWMEFIHGKTLEAELRERGPFPPLEIVAIGVKLADAIATVHRAGLIHRDVKAQNIMRDADGRLLLTDFGAGCELTELPDRQQPNAPVGTPLCVAPEVLAGREATPQSDIYSLGVLLYHLATGDYPFKGRSLQEVRSAHEQGRRTPWPDDRPELPQTLRDVVDRALHPDPARRFPSPESLGTALSALLPGTPESAVKSAQNASATAGRWPRLVLPVALGLLAIGGVGTAMLLRKPEPPVIAVLPLKNLGTGAGSDEFVDGLTDEIIRDLATIQGLQVRSQTSSFVFKDKPRNLIEVGRQLDANLVLEGSVQRADGRLRMNAQLVRVADDVALWSGRFDREISDIFAIQDEISRSIVNELRLKLGTGPRRYDTNLQAYEPYLRARALHDHKDFPSLRSAIKLYEEVTTLDRGFAPAYAGMANALADLSIFGPDYDSAYARIRAAAEKALELDPLLPEAHVAMGAVYSREREWGKADQAFRRALELDPRSSRAHTSYVYWMLFQMGRTKESLAHLQLALENDPLSLDIHRVLTMVQINAGMYDEAIANSRRSLDADPNFPFASWHLPRALLLSGRDREALEVMEKYPNSRSNNLLVRLYSKNGRHDEAVALADAAVRNPTTQAVLYATVNDVDHAFEALERAAAIKDPKVGGTLLYPELMPLRGDPRFAAFKKKIGLE